MKNNIINNVARASFGDQDINLTERRNLRQMREVVDDLLGRPLQSILCPWKIESPYENVLFLSLDQFSKNVYRSHLVRFPRQDWQ